MTSVQRIGERYLASWSFPVEDVVARLKTANQRERLTFNYTSVDQSQSGRTLGDWTKYEFRMGSNPFATFRGVLTGEGSGTRLEGRFRVSNWATAMLAALGAVLVYVLVKLLAVQEQAGASGRTLLAILTAGSTVLAGWFTRRKDRGKVLRILQQVDEASNG